MIEREITIETGEGSMGTFIVHPETDTALPVVVFLMDAPGKRPLLHDMARRIAENGYYVMLPHLYYRVTDGFILDFDSEESRKEMFGLMMQVGNAMVARDVGVLFDHAAADSAADPSTVGVVGYCMSGPFAMYVAAEHSDRVRAAASWYGVRLHVDTDDSPHRRLGEITGEIYVGAAEHDDFISLDEVDRFDAAMTEADTNGRVEKYWGNHHGFAFDDRPAYDPDADAQHWEITLDLFDRNLLAG